MSQQQAARRRQLQWHLQAISIVLLVASTLVTSHHCPDFDSTPGYETPPGFCASIYADGLSTPRGIAMSPGGTLLVVEAGTSCILELKDDDGDGTCSALESFALVCLSDPLTHGITVHDGFVYASSRTTVYRWNYQAGQSLCNETAVIQNMSENGHRTRSLVFDQQGRLYISIGSASNVDQDSTQAQIRRFTLVDLPLDFSQGELYADGLRNDVGLALDGNGVLWSIGHGADNLNRPDLGGDIHQDNPAEELNQLSEANIGRSYGYPYCWTEYNLPPPYGQGRGTQWAWPDTGKDDTWCRNVSNNIPPVLSIQGHSAPNGLYFYQYNISNPEGLYSFPEEYVGDAFAAFHGSWNRDTPTGYKVSRVRMSGGNAVSIEDFCWPTSATVSLKRPVSLAVGLQGELFFSDSSGSLLVVRYVGRYANHEGDPKGGRSYEPIGGWSPRPHSLGTSMFESSSSTRQQNHLLPNPCRCALSANATRTTGSGVTVMLLIVMLLASTAMP